MDCCAEPIVIDGPKFCGELRHVAHLEDALHRDRLQALVASGQLVVSADGLGVARLVPDGTDGLRVQIGTRFAPSSFASVLSDGISARLLEFRKGRVTAFGTLAYGETGVFRLTDNRVELVTLATEFLGVQSTREGVLVYVRNQDDDPNLIRICAPFLPDHLKVHRNAQVAALAGGTLLVLEPIDLGRYGTQLHRYTLNATRGFENLSPVPVGPKDTIVGLVRWRDVFLLGVRGANGSMLKSLGPPSAHMPHKQCPVTGELEHLWQSPTGESYACVTRVVGRRGGKMQCQFTINRQIIHIGDFTVGPFDLVWSPDGKEAALRIRDATHHSVTEHLISFGSRIPIRPGCHVEEFCVSNHGHVVAWIQTNGRFSEPVVHRRPHRGFEHAWNLSLAPDGTVSYNRVLSDVVERVTDRTHLLR